MGPILERRAEGAADEEEKGAAVGVVAVPLKGVPFHADSTLRPEEEEEEAKVVPFWAERGVVAGAGVVLKGTGVVAVEGGRTMPKGWGVDEEDEEDEEEEEG